MNKLSSMLLVALLALSAACSDDSGVSAVNGKGGGTGTEPWREYCLEKINEYRATEGIKPLQKADAEKQKCTTNQAAQDLGKNSAHGHFGICGEFAQNSGPNVSMGRYDSYESIVDTYLEMMWNEKKLVESGERNPESSEDYPYIGHYLNMKNARAAAVACGIDVSSDGNTGWLNINFF